MFRYDWSRLRIEFHRRLFDGRTDEDVSVTFFTVEELEQNSTVFVTGKGALDYCLTVKELGESEIVVFEAMRSKDPLLNLDGYESKGVLIIHKDDIHKTPVKNISYNESYWYEVSIE